MVGRHYTKADWDNRAYALKQAYDNFCQLAQQMAADIAPYSNAQLVARVNDPNFTTQDATDLMSGIGVADAIRQHTQRNAATLVLNDAQAITASQGYVALTKFGGA